MTEMPAAIFRAQSGGREGLMALTHKQRLAKLERKRRKRRERQRSRRTPPPEIPALWAVRHAAACPIHECYATQSIFQHGVGEVLLSRRVRADAVCVAGFLVDVYCRGAKDVFLFPALPMQEYNDLIVDRGRDYAEIQPVAPAYARKLVEGAVEYAARFRLRPHRDYQVARLLFGDINPAECDERFEFGFEGKPRLMKGVNDTMEGFKTLIGILTTVCGPDGFTCEMAVPTEADGDEDGPADVSLEASGLYDDQE